MIFEGIQYVPEDIRLIGLTPEKGPRYFESSDAPMKEDLSKAKWRALTDWESEAVEAMKNGAPYVSQLNPGEEYKIRILAPVHMRKECIECHDSPGGSIIGAFDYWMREGYPIRQKE